MGNKGERVGDSGEERGEWWVVGKKGRESRGEWGRKGERVGDIERDLLIQCFVCSYETVVAYVRLFHLSFSLTCSQGVLVWEARHVLL